MAKEKRRNYPPKSIEEAGLIFPICQQFFDGRSADEIAKWVQGELRERNIKGKFNRLHVYPSVWKAVQMDMVRFNPPREKLLEERISAAANSSSDASILREVCVSGVQGKSSVDYLASVAAEEIFRLIKKLAAEKCRRLRRDAVPVHIGLGAGGTTQRVAWSLGNLLRETDELDNVSALYFHALSSGFVSKEPLASPVAFFNYFSDLAVKVKYVALYSPPLVEVKDYDKIVGLAGAEEAFAQAHKIEIVTSALADVKNPHGLLNRLEDQYKQKKTRGRIGDFQFRPYTKKGPLKDVSGGFRAVTLFDLEDFLRMVEDEGKYLVLVVPPNLDSSTRANALLPIVTNPSLKVWSHLHLDLDTARELVDLLPPEEGAPENPETRSGKKKKAGRRNG